MFIENYAESSLSFFFSDVMILCCTMMADRGTPDDANAQTASFRLNVRAYAVPNGPAVGDMN